MPITEVPVTTERKLDEAEVPVRETTPETNPCREVVEAVQADCRVAPEEYVEELRVPIGGE